MADDRPEHVPLSDRLWTELDDAQRRAFDRQQMVEPTEDEKRNGWTAETLTAYIAEREAGAAVNIDPNSLHRKLAARPRTQNHRFNPKRWRG